MNGPRPPYTGRRRLRQSPIGGDAGRQATPFFRAAAVTALLMTTAGCASVGLPSPGIDAMQTGSINVSVADAVDPSDWETMRQTVAAMPGDVAGRAKSWENPGTGSYGALVAAATEQRSGGVCRGFSTTVNDLRGVRRYRGEACRLQGGDWQLTGVTPDDSKLL